MLIDMKEKIESNRSLFYSTALTVDRKEKLEELIDKLKSEGKSYTDEAQKLKYIIKLTNLLTPMTKYILAESANKITHDAIQIHGGTGYMKEFNVERHARDARITNIYEGTSQMQVVAAAGGVINDILAEYFEAKEAREYKGGLNRLAGFLKEIREIYKEALKYILDKKDPSFQDVAAKDLVDLYSYLYVGYLLLDEAEIEQKKIFVANRYILNSLANARKNFESIKNESFSDILHAEEILN
jgi:hypothetical protein